MCKTHRVGLKQKVSMNAPFSPICPYHEGYNPTTTITNNYHDKNIALVIIAHFAFIAPTIYIQNLTTCPKVELALELNIKLVLNIKWEM